MSKSNLHRFPKSESVRPKPTPVYHPAEGERLQDGEQSKIDYEVRIRLEGLAELPEENDFPEDRVPYWFPTIVVLLLGFTAGVFVASMVLSP